MFGMTMIVFAQAAATAASPPVAADPPKMTCRRYDVTGSLVKKQRVCRTAAAWRVADDTMRDEADRLIPHITTEHEIGDTGLSSSANPG